jgi:hypothetical protein
VAPEAFAFVGKFEDERTGGFALGAGVGAEVGVFGSGKTSRRSSTALSRSSHLISSELHQIKMPGVSKLQWPKNRVEAAYSTTKSAPQTTHMAESFRCPGPTSCP